MSSERVERRLTAVLAADVAGYSRLMGRDEEGTLARLKSVRKALVDPAIAEHHGRIVKTTGDGMLVEFASVVDALRCAVEIQRNMAERNAQIAEAKQIKFRVGINFGDIIIDGDDIFGDGVNVAARLEGLAAPGEICVSARVQEDAQGKLDISFKDTGEQQLKEYCTSGAGVSCPAERCSSGSTPGLAPPGEALNRGAPVPEHERRRRAGVFCRWNGRGDHHGTLAFQEPIRNRAQLELYVQGPRRGREAGRGRSLCA